MAVQTLYECRFITPPMPGRSPATRTPARPARPALQERYDRRRQEIVSAAARMFARQGYDQTTMQDLAASMGLATGALYHYFASKEHVLAAICDQLMEPLLARAREIVLGDEPPDDRLRTLVRLWVRNVVDYRDHMLVFQQERHVIEADARWRHVRESRKAFERIVQHALDETRATPLAGMDPRLSIGALLGMVNHTAAWYQPYGRLSAEQIADGYLALLTGAA
jgi:AcrR family transcriptional regulator